ncbi:flavin reductase [Bradyrhizobium japonicum]
MANSVTQSTDGIAASTAPLDASSPKDAVEDALVGPSVLDDGRAELDPRSFRTSLGQFGTGVTVVATQIDGRLAGTTIGSFSSLSLDPPLVLWSIARSSRSFSMFERARHFTINVLAEDQIGVSQQFSSSTDDKFAGLQWFKGSNGCPVLPGIVALFECEQEATYEGGDHLIIIGRVQRFVRYSGKPLLFVQSKYAVPQIHPQLQSAPDAPVTPARPESRAMAALSKLLLDATRLQVGRFEKHRRAEGVNYLQSRVLWALYANPGQAIGDLAQQIFAAPDDCADAVAELIERGLLTQDLEERVSLTEAGRDKRNAIQVRGDRYEAECLSGFSPEQISAVREFLEAFIRKFEDADSAL